MFASQKQFAKLFANAASSQPRDVLIKNIGTAVTATSHKGDLDYLHNVDILVSQGIISKIEPDISPTFKVPILDAQGALVTPGFIDPHTHLFPPKFRADEFKMRSFGKTYHDIAAAGGGILSSVNTTRNSTEDEIFDVNVSMFQDFFYNGVTTLEVKSGYGQSLNDEVKQLTSIRKLATMFPGMEVVPTFLGAHALPPEYKQSPDEYIDRICNDMLPTVASQGLAEYCDVFCEKGYFSVEQCKRVLTKAKELGLKIRLHADEFQDSGASQLAAELEASSADHLMAISESGIQALKKSNVVATVLPGTTMFLGSSNYAPINRMLDQGIPVALASDFNPGSSVFNSPPLMMQLAMTFGKCTFDAAFAGVTRNAALALDRPHLGIIQEDSQADLLFWNLENVAEIPYLSVNTPQHIRTIMKAGRIYDIPSKYSKNHMHYYDKGSKSGTTADSQVIDNILYTCKFDENGYITNIPMSQELDPNLSHTPKRNHTLSPEEHEIALTNALKYLHPNLHAEMKPIFKAELEHYGHIYGFNFLPGVPLHAVSFENIPGFTAEARSMIHMILNNLDPKVAQFPQELITYGGNGAVFSNWMQFHKTIHLLSQMTADQSLSMVSGHPQGLYPKMEGTPSAVITNGMMIPNYSDRDTFDNLYAMGTTMYGQMTAGSWMYIGPQGIVHGTHEVVKLASLLENPENPDLAGKIFVTSGLGGMSGAQPKATKIAGGICLVAEVDSNAIHKRHEQGWLDEIYQDVDEIIVRAKQAKLEKKPVTLGYHGNVVDLLEALASSSSEIHIELISDQTSLHNPFNGGYYPVGLSFDESNEMMNKNPKKFKSLVESSLVRQVDAINSLTDKGSFFWDYGNAFLLEAERANANLKSEYKSYVETMMGPELFDNGFGPYRWVVTSGNPDELAVTDAIAAKVIRNQLKVAPPRITNQLNSNLHWIENAAENHLTVGSQARILYSDLEGRINLALAMNEAIRTKKITSPIVIGRDHHDVSGTDSPYRETSNIKDGSFLTADMAIQNVIGDAMRGASWVSIHNGGGVGWGEVTNGGFGLVLDGTDLASQRAKLMLFWDVANGLTRRARAGNVNAIATIKELRGKYPKFSPFLPSI